MDGDDVNGNRLRSALRKGSSRKRKPKKTDMKISGEGIAVGNNNVIQIIRAERIIHRTSIDPMGGELSTDRKQRLKELVNGIVASAKNAGSPTTHQAVWSRFQRNFKVNTYHALPASSYERARKYLKMLYGRAKKGEL